MSMTKTATLKVPGASLYYEVTGSGPMLLMIPGAPADAGAFAAIAAQLADRYTVATYDWRGSSRSPLDEPPDLSDGLPIQVQGDDAGHLLAALADGPAYVLGCSGGALTGRPGDHGLSPFAAGRSWPTPPPGTVPGCGELPETCLRCAC
jgi:pimeloyl-ACP methyl ester carboxylesterase